MIPFLRWTGIVNAAVWFGSAIFFTVIVGPAFFSAEMKTLLTLPYAGAAAQIVLKRYFLLHYVCGLIAVLHLIAEWLYSGKKFQPLVVWVLVAVLSLGFAAGLWIQPKLKQLHFIKYSRTAPSAERERAAGSFSAWHGTAQIFNLFSIAGLLVYLSQMTGLNGGTRFVPFQKFRG